MSHSVKKHNCKLEVVCDWIEASILLDDDCEAVSRSDIVDNLVDSRVYDEQGFAYELLTDAWTELKRRSLRLGRGSPFAVEGNVVRRTAQWTDVPAHAYCVALSMVRHYENDWPSPIAGSSAEQGELFEKIAEESLTALGWSVLRTGWASGQSNVKLPQVVARVSQHLGESRVNESIVEIYRDKNEFGLDLIIHRPFHEDDRGGKPAFLVQCASGEDERYKRKTPDVATWSKLIGFSSNPVRAFAVPFAFNEDEFFRLCNDVEGMVLDRYRLLSAGRAGHAWISSDLRARLTSALKVRLNLISALRAS